MRHLVHILDDIIGVAHADAALIIKIADIGRVTRHNGCRNGSNAQQIFKIFNTAHSSAAVFLNNLQRRCTHFGTAFIIVYNIQQLFGKLGYAAHHFAGANLAQKRIGIFKVLHTRANQNRFGMSGRLKYVMAAMVN